MSKVFHRLVSLFKPLRRPRLPRSPRPNLEVLEDRLALSTLTITDASEPEGNLGSRLMDFTVRLSSSRPVPVTVQYSTTDGTATVADNDYEQKAGMLTFAPGQTRKTISVRVNGDHLVERDETFQVRLTNAH